MMIYGLGAFASHDRYSNAGLLSFVVGAGVALLGLIPSVVGAAIANGASADKARTGAFASYQQSLEQRLDVDDTADGRTTDDEDVEGRSDVPSPPSRRD